eukprot:scaffold7335_cov417-Prasinococcus_capsulatus_cf.AAC.11
MPHISNVALGHEDSSRTVMKPSFCTRYKVVRRLHRNIRPRTLLEPLLSMSVIAVLSLPARA